MNAKNSVLWISLFIIALFAERSVTRAQTGANAERTISNLENEAAKANSRSDWSELIASMDKMHIAMGAVARSGNSDVDFVRLMIPHHQGAIDMAKTQLLYGKDPQMRRLAQEIITDQQLEIELMQRWLKQQKSPQAKEHQTPRVDGGKEN